MLQNTRKQLQQEVRKYVNKIGPQLFKDFDKIKLLKRRREHNKEAVSKSPSKFSSTFGSNPVSKTDYEVSYLDDLEITRAFSCLAELENI